MVRIRKKAFGITIKNQFVAASNRRVLASLRHSKIIAAQNDTSAIDRFSLQVEFDWHAPKTEFSAMDRAAAFQHRVDE
jgi:hypothetical protein